MDSDDYVKLIDSVYKNILDKFNPGARQLINAGKAYLKALHGSAAASTLYIESVAKLARDSQSSAYGASTDVGNTLMKVMEVCKEIQEQQMNILKAFYVDLLLPLETNLEKDTKVVQLEQKRFLHHHKHYTEMYNKAVTTMKKQRKKSRSSSKNGLGMDKELKSMQVLEEEKTKLDSFCERSLKNALTQERRRYGFVLERQCSLAKHYCSFFNHSNQLYQKNVEEWNEVAKTRETLPTKIDKDISNSLQTWPSTPSEDIYATATGHHHRYNSVDDETSYSNRLRKSRSMDTSCMDLRSKMDETMEEFESLNIKGNRNSIAVFQPQQHHSNGHGIGASSSGGGGGGVSNGHNNSSSNGYGSNGFGHLSHHQNGNGNGLIKAKSEYNLASIQNGTDLKLNGSNMNLNGQYGQQKMHSHQFNGASSGGSGNGPKKWEIPLARALYAYLSSGENQLTFLEGDIIALIGERNKGWQYGENLRTQMAGWFPLAYTEFLDECISSSSVSNSSNSAAQQHYPPQTRHSLSNDEQQSLPSSSSPASSSQQQQQPHSKTDSQQQSRHQNGMKSLSSQHHHQQYSSESENNDSIVENKSNAHVERTRMFGDTFNLSKLSANVKQSGNEQFGPPPPLVPAPVAPTATVAVPSTKQLQNGNGGSRSISSPLHSSNDSGFSNDQQTHSMEKIDEDDAPAMKPLAFKNEREDYDRQSHHDHQQQMYKNRTLSPPLVPKLSYFEPISQSDNWYARKKKSTTALVTAAAAAATTTTTNGIKRSKSSFWKFGRNGSSSDSDILIGMAMWKHRDLMDTIRGERQRDVHDDDNDDDRATAAGYYYSRNGRQHGSDNDSDKTITHNHEIGSQSQSQSQPLHSETDIESMNYNRPRTLNRKQILEKYQNNGNGSSSMSLSLSLSSHSLTDDDETQPGAANVTIATAAATTVAVTNGKNVVAEIGKRLEQMSRAMHHPNRPNAIATPAVLASVRNYDPDFEQRKQQRLGSAAAAGGGGGSGGNHSRSNSFNNRHYGYSTNTSSNNGAVARATNNALLRGGSSSSDIYGAWYDLWESESVGNGAANGIGGGGGGNTNQEVSMQI